ncbi:hypothetical protein L9F63_003778, partial [Diploptera punctata]
MIFLKVPSRVPHFKSKHATITELLSNKELIELVQLVEQRNLAKTVVSDQEKVDGKMVGCIKEISSG